MTSGVNPAYFLRPIFEDTSHVKATLKVACDSFMRPGPSLLYVLAHVPNASPLLVNRFARGFLSANQRIASVPQGDLA